MTITKKIAKATVAHSKAAQVKKPAVQPGTFRVAAIQMASGPNVSANLAEAEQLIELAVEAGAKLIVLPEFFPIMGMKEADTVKARERRRPGADPELSGTHGEEAPCLADRRLGAA
jgi:deaminated glutathione amidase